MVFAPEPDQIKKKISLLTMSTNRGHADIKLITTDAKLSSQSKGQNNNAWTPLWLFQCCSVTFMLVITFKSKNDLI